MQKHLERGFALLKGQKQTHLKESRMKSIAKHFKKLSKKQRKEEILSKAKNQSDSKSKKNFLFNVQDNTKHTHRCFAKPFTMEFRAFYSCHLKK